MAIEGRSAEDVLREKYEERGWSEDIEKIKSREEVKPLPLSEEEYQKLSFLLAKIVLQDRDEKLCETYFELQRRAYYGNRYSPIDELEVVEEEMWKMGTKEFADEQEKHL